MQNENPFSIDSGTASSTPATPEKAVTVIQQVYQGDDLVFVGPHLRPAESFSNKFFARMRDNTASSSHSSLLLAGGGGGGSAVVVGC
ncbi:hypothetical protein FGIG_12631 [Fasciola gigantica]|uniref:Uncharacterized protein n=1 Tax=Fasciola gigantica TaxID=46835 RepID=A0A504YNU1_FASGI|nr:hypothetical protein FGIG_12631 [Fasciola gigantica]